MSSIEQPYPQIVRATVLQSKLVAHEAYGESVLHRELRDMLAGEFIKNYMVRHDEVDWFRNEVRLMVATEKQFMNAVHRAAQRIAAGHPAPIIF